MIPDAIRIGATRPVDPPRGKLFLAVLETNRHFSQSIPGVARHVHCIPPLMSVSNSLVDMHTAEMAIDVNIFESVAEFLV